jgi:hypothetical protein
MGGNELARDLRSPSLLLCAGNSDQHTENLSGWSLLDGSQQAAACTRTSDFGLPLRLYMPHVVHVIREGTEHNLALARPVCFLFYMLSDDPLVWFRKRESLGWSSLRLHYYSKSLPHCSFLQVCTTLSIS